MTSMSGARDWTRTSTPAKALAPEASASTNFATRATESREIVNAHNLLVSCNFNYFVFMR